MLVPSHCGEEMECVEYDNDDDEYLFRCTECGNHRRVTDEDEVWK